VWVTNYVAVDALKPSSAVVLLKRFTHSFSHKIKGLNSPLTWGYGVFPQVTGLVTTTTCNYIKTPVRFPLSIFKNNQLLKTKNLQSFTTAGRLTK